ncbi:MAG: thioredoxin domain-containing protein [Ignavibacteriales bacterium]|nr:thioredoxin domain-containing protein [Ignavibacteriales bacterium]
MINIPNRLINEKSPYLLQHAHNPVDWYPWGEEAFEKARQENKPIFLSIGYSTCYWCHVMEREVFENETIAQIMNEKMVNIKVDREERPDVDRVYMSALVATTGQGGWPMSVFLTHDLKPFYAATYIRPTEHHGKPGFSDLVKRISELWLNDRNKIVTTSDQITAHLIENSKKENGILIDESIIGKAYQQFLQNYDPQYCGFGNAPKFPRPSAFNFLLRYFKRTGNGSSLKIVLNTLRAMARGGMYDQLGGGFHRYSVDEQWRVPHFEKMLYDQAQLAISYLETYQITRDDTLLETAKGILDYVLIKLHHRDGGFYSAEDAESITDLTKPKEKEEGAFYVWAKSGIESIIGTDNAEIFNYYFGVEDNGNALQDHLNVFYGQNILYVSHNIDETAQKFGKSPDELNRLLLAAKHKLYLEREKRPHPHLDDKIITAWNGLMISAFAKAYQILEYDLYLETAETAARFIMNNLYDPTTQTLYRRYRDGDARFDGGLQDYAFMAQGLIDLYETTFNFQWLEYAISLTAKQIELFWDKESGGFFDTTGNDPSILLRAKEDYDGAEPTGNSIAALNLLKLSQITNGRVHLADGLPTMSDYESDSTQNIKSDWRGMAEKTIQSFGARLIQMPDGLPQVLVALNWDITTPKEIIIVGNRNAEDTKIMLREIRKHFLPNNIILLVDDDSKSKLVAYLPFIENMTMIDGKATAYICQNYRCQLPTNDIKKVAELLG